MKKRIIIAVSIIAIALVAYLVLQSGREEGIPKPRGYFRIVLPEKSYTTFESACPVSLEVPSYSKVEIVRNQGSNDSCWFNIFYPRFNARIHCTYLPVGNNLEGMIREAYGFAASHEMKASGMRRTLLSDEERKVYGLLYDIEGDAASQVQFFMTDSTSHFFRGSLYFFNPPNPDSIAPVLSFIREDIVHIGETIRWRN